MRDGKSHFTLRQKSTECAARLGTLETPHGTIQTPVFMPVGTRGTVKAMAPRELEELGSQIILGNTYHLLLRPGPDLIERAGGLHKFAGWNHPILTDSGGFQVFSLAGLRKMKPDGVEFSSHIDGSRFFLGPVESAAVQRALGSDIVMAFDECTPYPCSFKEAEKSIQLTHRWETLSREQPLKDGQQMFGIVQGSVFQELRERSAEYITSLDFNGYAIGGVSVGESEEEMIKAMDWTAHLLPEDKPRYLMGVGTSNAASTCSTASCRHVWRVMERRSSPEGSRWRSKGRNAARISDRSTKNAIVMPAGISPAPTSGIC